MSRYGCFDRAPYVASHRVPDGQWCDGHALTTKATSIKTTGTRKCQFTLSPLGQVDPRCADCGWKPGGRFDILEAS